MKTTGLIASTAAVASLLLSCFAFAGVAHAQENSDKMDKMGKMSKKDGSHQEMMARYAGPVYTGAPALEVTASLVAAGGGPEKYSTAKALTAMVGAKLVQAEVAKLTKQYGAEKVTSWLTVFDFAVKDALRIATEAGVKLPKPTLKGKKLAETLVTAGLDKDNTFYIEYLLDKAVTHDIHNKVMDNIDTKFGGEADADYHRITNQALYDLAQALGAKQVKLAEYH